MSLTVHLWTEEEFAAGREAWQELLELSEADPLFMGWDWQWTWWQHHRFLPGAVLRLLAVMDAGRLVALMPLYLRDTRLKGLLHVRRLECLGTAWREDDAVFSEYFDIIAVRSQTDAVVAALASWLAANRDWSEWVVSHVRNEALIRKLVALLRDSGARSRKVEAMPSQVIDLAAGFASWVEHISSDVRRRLHHQRGRLQESRFTLIGPDGVAMHLQRLQQWRAQRHKGGGSGHRVREFEQAVAARFAANGALRLSELTHRGKPLSMMFNMRLGNTEYYLASAFAPDAERGLSPGYLHFGYAIESACSEGATRFDLLAGHGRNRDYKSDLGGEERQLRSVQLLQSSLLKLLYRFTGSG